MLLKMFQVIYFILIIAKSGERLKLSLLKKVLNESENLLGLFPQ